MTGEDFTVVQFCADHRDILTGEPHGHTWTVQVYWPARPFRDARAMHAALTELLSAWDCKLLEEQGLEDTTNFGVASTIGKLIPNLSRVHVSRGGRVPCGSEVRL